VSTAYSLSQCSGTGGASDCDIAHATGGTTAADGSISTTYTVHTGTIGSGKCNPGSSSCFLVATTDPANPDPATNTAIHPLAFAAVPTITATPSTGVKLGQTVKVSGKNFKPSSTVALTACSSPSGDTSKCDISNANFTHSTDASGSFKNLKVLIATAGNGGKCKAGKTCFIAATTDISGQGADKSQDAVTTIKLASASAKVSTKTHAKAKGSKVVGSVKAGGKGVKGLKVVLDEKHGKHWKKVDSSKTKKAGKFKFSKLSSGKYEVKTPKQTKGGKTYGASHSHKVHVKASAANSVPGSPCANCTVA
jgi:hypothetical protein